MAVNLEQQLKEVGSKLEAAPSKDAVLKILKQAAGYLSELDQSPSTSVLESMKPFLNAIVKPELLKHQDRDVKLLLATCICEITRITAPEAPYTDDVLKDIFHLIVGTFSGLSDTRGPSFGRRVVILETLAKYRSCVVMLDLDCDELVVEMFSTFFAVVSDDHPESVFSSMETIMVVLIEESEDVGEDILTVILSVLGRNKSNVSRAARRLAMNVIQNCVGKLEAGIRQFLISSMSGDHKSAKSLVDYHDVIDDIYRCAPQILLGVVPYLTGELLTDELETRLKAVRLVGELFAIPCSSISEAFQPIFSEFLKRLTDRVVAVRMSVLQHVRSCLLLNPSRDESPQIISALCDRLLDFDENVRKQVVAVICDVKCHALNGVPSEILKLVAERLRDKSLIVKKYTMERLEEIYNIYALKSCDGSTDPVDFDWIPGKILRCFFDKDFRSDTIESVLCVSLFPSDFPTKNRVKHWLRFFSQFDKAEVKALERILEQKQRLQQEMQRYLSFRQTNQDGDAPEIQKKISFCFRIMSRSFADPTKAEENFQILDQLKDANVWRILANLVDANTSAHQGFSFRDDLLKILGEKHRLYDFLSVLSVKCSYLLFNKEHVKEILDEVATQKSVSKMQDTSSCMNLLVILARFSPVLFSGVEEELINFLKGDNEIIIEGVLHVLAKAGGTIREQLALSTSSIDLILERLCLEGTRKQAKYAVHALASITKDDGLKSLSVLYKRLVDMLEEKTHLPAVLQSLGCIAQTAMPVFETRESEIEEFIINKILKSRSKVEDNIKATWEDRSELCLLKIFGIKTLVKSYLPVKDAQVRPGINNLLGILEKILSYGEISEDIESSSVDKAHLKLASAKAVLRLSKHWDEMIPIKVFHLTLRISEINITEARRIFLSKVHQYIKDRVLDTKYACAFLFNVMGFTSSEFEEEKQNLADIIQMHYQGKARQVGDANSMTSYPEYILPYLVHALAHHSCPDVDECRDVKAFELVYRQLYLILSMLLHKDDDTKSEATTTNKEENIVTIISILQSIKASEDVVDPAKSKNSRGICDLGLSIIKRITKREDDLQESSIAVSLPPLLYKTIEKKDDLAAASETWFSDANVLVHFESLKLENTEKISAEVTKDEGLKDGERDGNEVPLGKMMKSLKSQGSKSKKAIKKRNLPSENKHADNDVDIMTMVRDINLNNLETPSKVETRNGNGHFPARKKQVDLKHLVSKKRKDSGASVSVSKRKKLETSDSKFRTTSKGNLPVSSSESMEMDVENSPDSKVKMSKEKKMVVKSKSDLLASSLRKYTSFSSKHKDKRPELGYDDESDIEVSDELDVKKHKVTTENSSKNLSNLKSSTWPVKKQKRKSIAGLAKCTSKDDEIEVENLIGCRIKVWWPMDKRFYEGTVKSHDPIKRKHVILYDDGDVEVLRLEKERWELVDRGRKQSKKLKVSKSSSSTEVSPGQKNKKLGGSPLSDTLSKITKGKRTPKKPSKQKQNGMSKTEFVEADERGSFNVSNPDITMSDGGGVNSGDPTTEHDEMFTGNLAYESDKEVKKQPGEKLARDLGQEDPSNMKEFDEVERPSIDERAEDSKLPQDAPSGGEVSHKEGTEDKKSMSREEIEEGESDADENQETKDEEMSPEKVKEVQVEESATDHAGKDMLSDDEPLSKWTHRAGRRASKK